MNPIVQGIAAGYSAQKILGFISKAFPAFAPKIKQAQGQGHSVEQILGFLSKTMQTTNPPGMSQQQVHASNRRNEETLVKNGITALGGSMAAYAASRALPPMLQGLTQQQTQPQTPQLPTGPSAAQPPQNQSPQLAMGQGNTQQNAPFQPPISPAQAPTTPNIPQSPAPTQPIIPQRDIKKSLDIIKSSGLETNVKNMLEGGMSPPDIAAVLPRIAGKDLAKKLGKIEGGLEGVIEDYAQPMPKSDPNLAQQQSNLSRPSLMKEEIRKLPTMEEVKKLHGLWEKSGKKIPFEKVLFGNLQIDEDLAKQLAKSYEGAQQPEQLNQPSQGTEQPAPMIEPQEPIEKEELNKEPKTIEKNSVVASPHGVGEVKEVRNGQAIIDVDGKKHKVDVEDLENEPEDVIEEVQKLLKIPEVDRSSIVSLFTFDPEEKKMYIQFHNGESFKYLDVDPEKVRKIADKMGIPVTKGQNIFGAWSQEDKNSLGATLIKEIINDPKYKKAKKGEPANTNYVKLETLYDYWEKLRKKPKRKNIT